MTEDRGQRTQHRTVRKSRKQKAATGRRTTDDARRTTDDGPRSTADRGQKTENGALNATVQKSRKQKFTRAKADELGKLAAPSGLPRDLTLFRVFLGTLRVAGPKPIDEPNRCDLKDGTPKTSGKALFVVSLLQGLPLYVGYFGLPCFALPTRARRHRTTRRLGSSVFGKNGCQGAEDGGQRTEDRGQRTEDGGRRLTAEKLKAES